jgi:hypothetical protein
MNEILLFILAIAGVFSIACSIALISLGTIIDRFPVGDESSRKRSFSSPMESTRISVIVYWALFVIGGVAILQESRIILILGITTLFAGVLFMFTALIFSFAVLHAMRQKRSLIETPVPRAIPVSVTAPAEAPAAGINSLQKKHYNRPVSNFMINALMKRE